MTPPRLDFGDRVAVEPNPLPKTIPITVNINAIRSLSSNFPNKELRNYILTGLSVGFKTGFCGPFTETSPNNLKSAVNNQEKVSNAIAKEIERKHTSGPFIHPPISPLHCSPIGSTDKPDGSVRLVMDLSQPEGSSIKGIGGGSGVTSQISFVLTYVVALHIRILKWAHFPLIPSSCRLAAAGVRGVFAKIRTFL